MPNEHGADVGAPLAVVLDTYEPATADEARDIARIRTLVIKGDPWTRSSKLHVTCSAIIVHPESGRVLLRWHERMNSWLQVGGHADIGETSPYAIALREAQEETGLNDLAPWPDASRPVVVQIVIVPVPAGRGEAQHEHADIRYLLATDRPEAARPESESAQLRWLEPAEAASVASEDSTRTFLRRIAQVWMAR